MKTIEELFTNHIFLYVIGGLCGLGVILKFFLLIVYNKMIKQSETMTTTRKKWMQHMRTNFEHSYEEKRGVHDVDIYVDKYVSKVKIGGLLLSTWANISGQMIGLCLLTGSFASVWGLIEKCGKDDILFTFFAGAWGAIIVNIVDNIVNISAHQQLLRYNLKDYFINHLQVSMEQKLNQPEDIKSRREYITHIKNAVGDIATSIAEGSADRIGSKHIDTANFTDRERKNIERMEQKLIKQKERFSEEENKKNEYIEQLALKRNGVPSMLTKKQQAEKKKMDKLQAKAEKELAKKRAKDEKEEKKEEARLEKSLKSEEKRKAQKEKKQIVLDQKQAKIDAKQDKIDAKKREKEEQKRIKLEQLSEKENKKLDKAKEKEEERLAKQRVIDEQKNAKIAAAKAKEELNQKKALENNKAYREKMRLKEEKEREAKKRESEKAKLDELRLEKLKANEYKESNNSVNEKSIEPLEDEFEDFDNLEPISMTATSKEDDELIEEVLKDFFS